MAAEPRQFLFITMLLAVFLPGVTPTASAVPANGSATPTPTVTPATPAPPTLQTRAEEAMTATEESWGQIEELLKQRVRTSDMEELQIIDAQINLRVGLLKKRLGELLDIIDALEEAELPARKPRRVARRILDSADRLLWKNLSRTLDAVRKQTLAVRTAPAGERLVQERRLSTLSRSVFAALRSVVTVAGYRRRLGVDVSKELSRLDAILQDRLERVAGELEVAARKRDELTAKIGEAEPEEAAALKKALPAREEEFERAVRDLTDLVGLAEQRGLEVDAYKKLLIQATGAVSVGMLNREVAAGLVRDAWRKVRDRFVTNAPLFVFRFIVFLVILAAFWLMSRIVGALVRRIVTRPGAQLPEILRGTVISGTRNGIVLVGFVIGLSSLGVEIGPILAGLGIAGFIVGFALQDSLSNFAAGMMILVYRPFDVGDAVEAGGVFGKVDRVSLVSTTIKTFDNQRIVIPNRRVWGDVITNRTAYDTRRVDFVIYTGFDADADRVVEILAEVLAEHPLVLEEPKPIIRMQRMTENALEFVARPWTETRNYWTVFRELNLAIKRRFDAEGIPPPAARREVLVRGSSDPAVAGGA